MFIETHIDTVKDQSLVRTFISSTQVQAFPCGRRRSALIEEGEATKSENYRIPFDPEARLNTEANNRKHSSLNGFTQTYLNSWVDNRLSLVLAGYLFNISCFDDYSGENNSGENDFGDDFGDGVITSLENANNLSESDKTKITTAKCIYANIVIKEDVKLFSSFPQTYFTGVLHKQQTEDTSGTVLDILCSGATDPTQITNYYFSGLSFSVMPLTGKDEIQSELEVKDEAGNLQETWVSLRILERDSTEDSWKICESAKLPKIAHGSTEDSVAIERLEVTDKFKVKAQGDIVLMAGGSFSGSISAEKIMQNGVSVPTIKLKNRQLQITTSSDSN